MLLNERHNYDISYSTLLRRLKVYGLRRRGFFEREDAENNIERARQEIQEIINGPGSCAGYRTTWHTLEMKGLRVPRIIVQDILKELDPDGCNLRKARRLRRRIYHNPGPNHAWHMDGYDKLKPFGFPIHGAIDGFSRRILWLKVTRSNNSPDNIASFFLDMVNELKGCPIQLITDLGTENGLAASMQCYFRDNSDAHRYVSSPRNQRIEGWWSYYARSRSTWWRNYFKDLESQGVLDSSSELCMGCIWYCFAHILQEDLNNVKEHWNSHRIRKSRHNTVPGRPDSLFFLPEHHGGVGNLLCTVPQLEIDYTAEHILQVNQSDEYQDYFEYVKGALHLYQPRNWQEADSLFRRLMVVSETGG